MRTDRTFVCTDCRIRCWPVRRCPACGETRALADLERTPDAVSNGPRPSGDTQGTAGVLGALGGMGVGGSIVAIVSGSLGVGEVGLVLSLPMLLGGVALWQGPSKRVVPGDLRYRVLAAPVARTRAERTRHVGTVRARATLRAPLSGRECVAWRLWAEGPRGEIDDAMAVPFAVRVGGGEPDVEVDARVASIDLPMPDGGAAPLPLDAAGALDAAIAGWLRARGVDRVEEPLQVREAILAEGDPVEVVGTARRESTADGYRGSRIRDVLVDLPGSPLRVGPPAGST